MNPDKPLRSWADPGRCLYAEQSIDAVASQIAEVGMVVVVDAQRRPLGVVSAQDLLRLYLESLPKADFRLQDLLLKGPSNPHPATPASPSSQTFAADSTLTDLLPLANALPDTLILVEADGTYAGILPSARLWQACAESQGNLNGSTSLKSLEQNPVKLSQEANLLSNLIHTIPDLIWLKDPNGVYLRCNPRFEDMYGASEAEIIGKTDSDFVSPDQARFFRQHDLKAMEAGLPLRNEEWLTFAKDGYQGLFETIKTPMFDDAGQVIGVLGIARDISEKHRMHQDLFEQKQMLDTVFEQLSDAVVLIDPETQGFLLFNQAACQGLGYSSEEFARIKVNDYQAVFSEQEVEQILKQVLADGKSLHLENRHRHRDGSIQDVQATLNLVSLGGKPVIVDVWRDVTESNRQAREQKQAETKLKRLNRIYAILSRVNEAIVWIRDPQALYLRACEIAVDLGDFLMAWVGRVDHADNNIHLLCYAGHSDGYVEQLKLNLYLNHGPTSQAITSGQYRVCNDIANDSAMAPWREAALARGYRASAAFPVLVKGRAQATLNLYAKEPDYFDNQEITLFQQLTADLGFALEFIEAETAARKEQHFRQQLLDSVAGLFFAFDPSGRFVLWNRPLETTTGYSGVELKQTLIYQCFSDPPKLQSVANSVLAEGFGNTEVELLHKSGLVTPYFLTLNRLELDGQFLLTVTGVDITDKVKVVRQLEESRQHLEELVVSRTAELQISERRFRNLIEGVQQDYFFFSVGADHQFTYLSPSAAEFLGQPPEDLLGKPWFEVLQLGALGQVQNDSLIALMLQGKDPPVFELELTLQGEKKFIEIYEHISRDADGRIIGGEGVVKNITRQKKIEAELKAAKINAEASNQAKSSFLANMSHEIRTPLNAILGFSELMQEQSTDKRFQQYLEAINASGKALLKIINDVLDLSKIEAGKMSIRLESVNLRQLIAEIHTLMAMSFQQKSLDFKVSTAESLPDWLELDGVRLRQVLLNLLSNALKFTQRGGVHLKVSYFDQGPDDGDLQIDVCDTGMGISPAQQQKIFEAFEQNSETLNTQSGGTGLGLTISRSLVKLMGGQLHLQSTPGEGSCFRIRLPQVHIKTSPEVSQTVPIILPEQFLPARILVVDDVPENLFLVQAMLEQYPFEILLANNGKEACEIASYSLPDLILMDIKMPVMDGIEALHFLKSKDSTCQIPVLAVTAFSLQQEQENIQQQGFAAYLRKPVQKAELLNRLRDFLPTREATISNTRSETASQSRQLSESERQDLQVLLQKDWLPRWQTIRNSVIVDELDAFAASLQSFIEPYPLDSLHQFVGRLRQQILQFDLEQAQRTLETFPDLVDSLTHPLTF